jgi:cell division septal protein FtsQ
MKKRSASTLIYFNEKARKKNLLKRPKHINKEKRTRHIIIIFRMLTGLVFLGGLTWFYISYRPLDIKSVDIVGAERFVSKEDVRKIAEEKVLDRNIVFLDSAGLREALAKNFLASKSVEIKRVLPNRLVITISERVPIALISSKYSKDFVFVDAEGFILGLADKDTTNLPVIKYSQEVGVGKFVEAHAVKYYFDLIRALDADNVAVSTISSYPRYTEFYIAAGLTDNGATQVLFTNDQNPRPQVKILSRMAEAFKAEGKKLKKIDLRFDKVIVEFDN